MRMFSNLQRKRAHVLVPGANLPQPRTFRTWGGLVTDLAIVKATELLKLFLIEAVPLDFPLALGP